MPETIVFLLLIWHGALLFSFYGWGLSLARICNVETLLNGPIKLALGFAFFICIGAWLNLWFTFTAYSLATFVLGGCFLAVHSLCYASKAVWAQWARSWLLGLLALILYAGWCRAVPLEYFMGFDDLNVYFVFAEKMIQNGGLGPDPFSGRRFTSSLGAFHLINATGIYPFEQAYNYAWFLDRAILAPFLMMLLWRSTVSLPLSVRIFILSYPVFISWRPNATPTNALFLLGFATLAISHRISTSPSKLAMLPLAMLAATLLSIKTTTAPVVLAVLFHQVLCGKIKDQWRVLLFCGFSIFLILPWSLDLYRSNQVLFYPILSWGTFVSHSSSTPSMGSMNMRHIFFDLGSHHYVSLSLILFGVFSKVDQSTKKVLIALPAAFIVGSIYFSHKFGVIFYQYTEEYRLAIHLYCIVLLANSSAHGRKFLTMMIFVATMIALFFFSTEYRYIKLFVLILSIPAILHSLKIKTDWTFINNPPLSLGVLGVVLLTHTSAAKVFYKNILSPYNMNIEAHAKAEAQEYEEVLAIQKVMNPGLKFISSSLCSFKFDLTKNPCYNADFPFLIYPHKTRLYDINEASFSETLRKLDVGYIILDRRLDRLIDFHATDPIRSNFGQRALHYHRILRLIAATHTIIETKNLTLIKVPDIFEESNVAIPTE